MLEYFPIDKNDFEGKVLVTGAGGCIGSWALALLNRAGVPAAAFDLSEDKRRPKLLMADADLAKVQWLTGDIGDSETVRKAVKASGARSIIHLAALQVPFCKADPVAGAQVNVVGTINVFEAARKLGIKRIAYASSIAAHGAIEGHGTLPTLYGAYKHCNEQTAKVYSNDWGVHSVGLRPGVVYGVGRDQGMTSKTTVAILAAAANQP
jgi:nucleoside-diphosphate-sugar epimerase